MATAFAPHTLSSFDTALSGVRDLIDQMAASSSRNVAAALRALTALEPGQMELIKEADAIIDGLERQIEDSVVRALTLHSPMANDLRELVASLRIATQLERAGDQAKSIAKRVPDVVPLTMASCLMDIDQMGSAALCMLTESARSFRDCDITAARSICDRDAQLNEAFEQLSIKLIKLVSATPEATTVGMDLLSIGKHIERLGDYAVNVADEVIFMLSGQHRSN